MIHTYAALRDALTHWILACLLITLSSFSLAETAFSSVETVFTHRAPESATDSRTLYEVAVLQLALEKTRSEFGNYRLEKTPPINVTRSIRSIRANNFTNFFYSLGYQAIYDSYPEMTYIQFPIDMGVLGYRTCFTSEQNLEKLAKVNTLEDLKKFTHGQGRGWVDGQILRHNGFTVIEVEQYDTLFKMTAAHRFDLFCRGANEVKDEYEAYFKLKDLAYDRSLMIYYPMPIFLYTNSANTEAIKRVTKGINIAFADGSLHALWAKQHQASVDFASLDKRKVFHLENPLIKSINFDHEQYNYHFKQKSSAPIQPAKTKLH